MTRKDYILIANALADARRDIIAKEDPPRSQLYSTVRATPPIGWRIHWPVIIRGLIGRGF